MMNNQGGVIRFGNCGVSNREISSLISEITHEIKVLQYQKNCKEVIQPFDLIDISYPRGQYYDLMLSIKKAPSNCKYLLK